MKLISFCIAIAVIALSTSAKSDYRSAFDLITNFAQSNCEVVQQQGESSSQNVKGEIQAGISGLFKKLAEAGVSGTVETNEEKYKGVLQSDLAASLQDVRSCRERIINRLLPLIDKLSADQHEELAPYIKAGSDPSPPNACSTEIEPDDIMILVASNANIVRKFPHTVLQVKGKSLISIIRHEDNSIGLNIEVIGEDGRYLAKVSDNRFAINLDKLLSFEPDTRNHYTIKSKDMKTFIDVNFHNKNSISIIGRIFYKGIVFSMSSTELTIGSGKISNNCFIGAKVDINVE